MSITLKEIVKILNLEKFAPIHYILEENLNEENYIYFKFITEKEKSDLKNGVWNINNEYDLEDIGVYIPDIEIDRLVFLEKCRNPWNIEYILDLISFKIKVPIDEYNLIYSLFSILHEVGHWLNFIKLGITGYEYYIEDSKYRLEVRKEGETIYKLPDDHYMKRKLADSFNEKYRKIPNEASADEYAFERIDECLKIVRKYLGKNLF